MIVGIDINPAARAQKTGTEWYAHNLVTAMQQPDLTELDRLLLYSREPLPLAKGESEGVLGMVTILKWPFRRLWTQVRLSWEMLRRPPDVLFVPAHALPWICPKKTITTIHDVGFLRYPDLYEPKARRYLRATTNFAVKHCTKILTPSEFTKAELMDLYHLSEDRIVVTPLAPGNATSLPLTKGESEGVRTKYQLSANTFVTVSRMESKKNIVTLIKAFEQFKAHRGVGDPFQLVLVGKPGFGYEAIKQQIDHSPQRAFIRELGWVEEGEVPVIMAQAFAYVYPSWYEGLGISALEAMAAGVPLIASNIPALHEAAGEAACYFDPRVPADLARVMTYLSEEPAEREAMIVAGKKRVNDLSWTITAERTWKTIRSML